MIVSLLVAMDEGRGIGKDNQVPWHLSADLKRFKALTLGHHMIMGRKTYESIGRPLPGRTTIVVTRNPSYSLPGVQNAGQPSAECLIAHSLEEALQIARERGEVEAFVIGGSEIFEQALQVADRLYLTLVHTRRLVDVYFPLYDQESWIETESFFHPADEKNEYPFTFKLLQKKN